MTQPPKHRMLLITGDAKVQEHVYQKHQHGYWSAGFNTVLEKNGFLDFDQQPHSVLEDADFINQHDIILLGWLPHDLWRPKMIQNLQDFAGIIIAEGGIPTELHDLFHVTDGNILPQTEGKIDVLRPDLHEWLNKQYSEFYYGGRIHLKEKNILTRPVRENRWDMDFVMEEMDFSDLCRRVVRTFRAPYLNRFRNARYFPKSRDNLFALYFLCAHPQRGFEFCDEDYEVLGQTISYTYKNLEDEGDIAFLQKICAFLPAEQQAKLSPFQQEKTERSPLKERLKGKLLNLAGYVRDNTQRRTTHAHPHNKEVLYATLPQEQETLSPDEQKKLETALSKALSFDDGKAFFKKKCNNPTLAGHILSLKRLGRVAEAEILCRLLIDHALSFETGAISNILFEQDTHQLVDGFAASPILALAFLTMADDLEEPAFIGTRFDAQYGTERIQAWQARPYQIHDYKPQNQEQVLAAFTEEKNMIISHTGRHILFSFQVFAYIVHYHTMHPLKGPFTDCDAAAAMVLEAILFNLLQQQSVAEKGAGPLHIDAWPHGYKYCVTVRHDVDRIPPEQYFKDLTDFERENNLAVSWYWIFTRLNLDYIHRIENFDNHEIALHSMKHETRDIEVRTVSETLSKQDKIYGDLLHGGGGGEYWLGYPSIEASAKSGMAYAESMSTYYDYPYRFPLLQENGQISQSEIITLSHAVSIDRNIQGNDRPWNTYRIDNIIDNGFYLQIMNHPDHYLDRLKRLISDIPTEGRLDWTCQKLTEWWQATHNKEHLSITTENGSDYTLCCQYDVEDVVLSLPLGEQQAMPEIYLDGEKQQAEQRVKNNITYCQWPVNLVKNKPCHLEIKLIEADHASYKQAV